jgi:hypothetical protein
LCKVEIVLTASRLRCLSGYVIPRLVNSAVCFTFVLIKTFKHDPGRVYLLTNVIKATHLFPYAQGIFMISLAKALPAVYNKKGILR